MTTHDAWALVCRLFAGGTPPPDPRAAGDMQGGIVPQGANPPEPSGTTPTSTPAQPSAAVRRLRETINKRRAAQAAAANAGVR